MGNIITGKSVGRTIMYIKSDDGRIIYESIYVTVRASKKGEKGVLSMDISHSDVFKH